MWLCLAEQGDLLEKVAALINTFSARRDEHVQAGLAKMVEHVAATKEETSRLFAALHEGSVKAADEFKVGGKCFSLLIRYVIDMSWNRKNPCTS